MWIAEGTTGPYAVRNSSFDVASLDPSDRRVEVLYPDAGAQKRFPLLVYAHGGKMTPASTWYSKLGPELASWGYVVAFPNSCQYGCENPIGSPPSFGRYFTQLLLVLQWAHTPAASGLPTNLAAGVGLAGHSLGAQAALVSSASAKYVAAYRLRAVVLHHPYKGPQQSPRSRVPILTFTGTADTAVPAAWARQIYSVAGESGTPRGFASRIGANHYAPCIAHHAISFSTVAWLKLFVDDTPRAHGVDWDAVVFGNGSRSICGGGGGAMYECRMDRGH